MSRIETFASVPYSLYAGEAWQKYPYDPVKAYIDLSFSAEKEDTVYRCDYGSVELRKGQFATTYSALAKRWRCDINRVRLFLKILETNGLIERGRARLTGDTHKVTQITLLTVNALRGSSTQQFTHMNNNNISNDIYNNNNKRASSFSVPSVQEIQDYLNQIGEHRFTAEEFYDYYDTRGWLLTKGIKMKSWKGAVRTWRNKENNRRNDYISRSAQKARDRARSDEEFRQHIITNLASPEEQAGELPFR